MNTLDKRLHRAVISVVTLALPTALLAQHEIEEVQVIATPQDQSVAELAQSVTVLGGDELQRAQSASLGETLAGELGVSATSFGAAASRPVIRGLAGGRVKMMQDGIDSLDVSTISQDHSVGIDPLVAEQIEIFRGPTTLLYGSGAVGGVVNTVTRRIPESIPEEPFEGEFELRGDTAASEQTGAMRLDGGGSNFAWHFDGLSRDSEDYEIPGFAELEPDEDEAASGVVENSSFDTTSLSLGASWIGDRGFFGVAISSYESNYGVPGHGHEEEHHDDEDGHDDEEEEIVRIDLNQTRIDLKGGLVDLSGPIEAVNFRLGFNDYEHQELEGAEIGTLFENEAYEGRAEFLHRPWGEWDGAFGVQFGEQQFSALGEEAFIPPVDTSTLGLFILEHRAFGNWDVSLGGRWETQEHKPTDPMTSNVSDSAASASFAAIRPLSDDYALALHVAVAQRLPGAEELFANGPHLASSTFEIGDPTLDVETSQHMDIGIRKTSGTLTWSLTGFYTSFADFIFLRDSGAEDMESELPIFLYNQEDATVKGLEAELFTPVASLGSGEIDLRIFADYVDGELDNGENLPRLPPLRVGARVQYHAENLVLGLEAARYDEQDDVAMFEESTPGYTMLNTDLSWTLPTVSSGMALNLFFKGTNLLDEDARRHTSLLKDVAPLPGRNYQFGVRASF